ncbi:diguanylate cyclase (GGDEF domain) [Sulfurimonas denitrificans DSM 1251]|jgi:diguanylate cyclase (GGDEF)-like protein|uniref:diguanylate cyclase n=1 Tax=Sulfurimonas denitrificans (strain ATCC 33889 / DSM 1251) TaxID=326298 RepID=Q30QE3_SULDN|nr:GGDEF domain-containing protein [Sulfurimonas denitrificans]ABB44788.1 diguanylate cyclase (GGDEF domain) [Sulfurimonas denitrificans DSM 1251]MDD3443386.1 GGDEF domain-containing protein [Sulfurimonas denitrificans]
MNFIDTLKLRSKLFSIFIILSISLLLIGIMGAININSMKKKFDALYFGSFVPVNELNIILQTYHDNLGTAYKAKEMKIPLDEIRSEIKLSVERIENEWKSYKSHFKRDEEIAYVEYVSGEIKNTNDFFLNIYTALDSADDIKNLPFDKIEKRVTDVHKVIKKLINYEIDLAKYERKNFLLIYDSSLYKIGTFLLIIIFGVMVISYYVLKSIQSDQNALEIASKKLKIANKRLESASYTDSLTSLHNRRYFNMVYEREIKRAKRNYTYITFMMLDIDYFKQYNDTYGHVKGDVALKSVASVFKELLKRPGDFVFRLGGEEFGILLTDTSEVNTITTAQNICNAVKELKIEHEASKIDTFLTISIGVACCVADSALDEEVLINKADEMLYSAKEGGRNRYSVTTHVSVATPLKLEEIA